MSNQTVGTIYQQIIRDVVETSRVDFEEGGVDESVLDELSRLWQQKLSQLNVAQFPWDPKPEPLSAPNPLTNIPMQQNMTYQPDPNAPPMPQMGGHQTQFMHHPANQPHPPHFQQMPPHMVPNQGVRIKTEPGLEQPGPPPAYGGMSNATTAQQRAAQNLQATYGSRAAASISAIHGMPQPGQQPQHQQSPHPQVQAQQQLPHQLNQQPQQQHQQQRPPGPAIQRPPITSAQQYQQAMVAQHSAAQKQQAQGGQHGGQQVAQGQRPNPTQGQGQHPGQHQGQSQGQNQGQAGAQHSQTDGGGDDEDRHSHFGVIRQVGADGAEVDMGRVDIDGLIRRQIEARGKAMEGGGLMLPLKQHKTAGAPRDRKRTAADSKLAQTDGGDDDDDDDEKLLKAEEDEDAINSDLDDPDDPKSDDSGDEETPQVMLCMYDKVQRVKNKWKCVMKDGVLTINGKDYVFHKASGDYEW